jgi:hypothetical protein
MTKTTSFQADIRPLFTEQDIRGMSEAFNLGVKMTSGCTRPPSTTAFGESVAR